MNGIQAYIVRTQDNKLVMAPGGSLCPASVTPPLIFYDVEVAVEAARQTGREDWAVATVQYEPEGDPNGQ